MKYGESAFDIFYLVTAIIVGLLILRKPSDRPGKWPEDFWEDNEDDFDDFEDAWDYREENQE